MRDSPIGNMRANFVAKPKPTCHAVTVTLLGHRVRGSGAPTHAGMRTRARQDTGPPGARRGDDLGQFASPEAPPAIAIPSSSAPARPCQGAPVTASRQALTAGPPTTTSSPGSRESGQQRLAVTGQLDVLSRHRQDVATSGKPAGAAGPGRPRRAGAATDATANGRLWTRSAVPAAAGRRAHGRVPCASGVQDTWTSSHRARGGRGRWGAPRPPRAVAMAYCSACYGQ